MTTDSDLQLLFGASVNLTPQGAGVAVDSAAHARVLAFAALLKQSMAVESEVRLEVSPMINQLVYSEPETAAQLGASESAGLLCTVATPSSEQSVGMLSDSDLPSEAEEPGQDLPPMATVFAATSMLDAKLQAAMPAPPVTDLAFERASSSSTWHLGQPVSEGQAELMPMDGWQDMESLSLSSGTYSKVATAEPDNPMSLQVETGYEAEASEAHSPQSQHQQAKQNPWQSWMLAMNAQSTKPKAAPLTPHASSNQVNTVFASLAPATVGQAMYDVASMRAAPMYELKSPIATQQWQAAFVQQMMMVVKDGVQHASFKLNPPELGVIEIKLAVLHDQASVQFISPHLQVREALESALPRLREQFQEQGMQLTQSDVSSQNHKGRQDQANAQLATDAQAIFALLDDEQKNTNPTLSAFAASTTGRHHIDYFI